MAILSVQTVNESRSSRHIFYSPARFLSDSLCSRAKVDFHIFKSAKICEAKRLVESRLIAEIVSEPANAASQILTKVSR